VPEGAERAALARGNSIVLADGRRITPEMVQGPTAAGAKLAIVGDAEEVASLIDPVRRADALVIEATFLERDATRRSLARAGILLPPQLPGWHEKPKLASCC
jgi:ribonuclease Z